MVSSGVSGSHGVMLWLFWALLVLNVTLILLVIPFYLSYGNIVGTVLSVVLFWVFAALSLALMYYFPLFYHMRGDTPVKTLKKSFILLLDNLGFSLFQAIYQMINLAISVMLAVWPRDHRYVARLQRCNQTLDVQI